MARHHLWGQNLGNAISNRDRMSVGQGIDGIEKLKHDLCALLLRHGRAGDVIVNQIVKLL